MTNATYDILTQAITEFGLCLGDAITMVFNDGNSEHKNAIRKIFSDALSETNRLLSEELEEYEVLVQRYE